MSEFYPTLNTRSPAQWDEFIQSRTLRDVHQALNRAPQCSINDLAALLSPAAQSELETMARLSQQITQRRFGKTIQLYVPLYLSNTCHNVCTYCGFSLGNKTNRITLTPEEILREGLRLKELGFKHILLVTGEDHRVDRDYFLMAIKTLKPLFSQISLEVQPLSLEDYTILQNQGLHAVYLYQETYHEQIYKQVHLRGKKSFFDHRLEVPDLLGKAGIHKIGLGCLLGLAPWRVDALYLALHLQHLEKRYWMSKFSISFPRLRPAEGGFTPAFPVSEKNLLQIICAYRIFNENVELALSTRESPFFRNNALSLGITTMSAGSRTNPGGYGEHTDALEQFSISDERSPIQVAQSIQQQGYEAVWKDWDTVLAN